MSGRIEVYRGTNGRWWWRHIAGNGQVDGASEQGYRRSWYARRKALAAFPGAPVTVIGGP